MFGNEPLVKQYHCHVVVKVKRRASLKFVSAKELFDVFVELLDGLAEVCPSNYLRQGHIIESRA